MDPGSENTDRKPSTWRAGVLMFMIAFFGCIALLTWLSSDYLEKQRNPNANISGQVNDGSREVTLRANRQGHYVVRGTINETEVVFFLDTGATTVSIPASIADQIGLKRGPVVRSETAAGIVENFATRLDTVKLGPIVMHDVLATINPHTTSDEILLGMSFLRHLELSQKDRELLIRQ